MWPPWSRNPRDTAAASPPRLSHPAYSFSFKDVHALLRDEDNPDPTTSSAARKPSIFHRVRIATTALRTWRSLSTTLPDPSPSSSEEKRIVVYFTSLRVVRKTFEDCRAVRSILRGFLVSIDERDLSMDSRFLAELKGVLGRKQLNLPRVFIGGRYIGGADEIRQLHENGELKNFVEGAPPASAGVCECCGGVRFVLCQSCDGSHKCYTEKSGFRSCTACNENGLVRCADCCLSAV